MFTKTLVVPCLSVALTLSACGDDTDNQDVDGGDSGRPVTDGGTDASRGVLDPGTYWTSNLREIDGGDGCDLALEKALDPDGGNFASHELRNDGTVLKLGRFYDEIRDENNTIYATWVPPGYTLGEGPWQSATTATLTLDTEQTFLDDDCAHDLLRISDVTFTGTNKLSVVLTHSERNFSSQCNAQLYPTTGCTSRYAFDLTKP